MPHADFEGGGRGVFLLREPQGERLRDQVDGLARQVDVLTLDPFGGDSAHVAAVLQLEHGFLGDGHGCSSRHDKFFSAGGGPWARGACAAVRFTGAARVNTCLLYQQISRLSLIVLPFP